MLRGGENDRAYLLHWDISSCGNVWMGILVGSLIPIIWCSILWFRICSFVLLVFRVVFCAVFYGSIFIATFSISASQLHFSVSLISFLICSSSTCLLSGTRHIFTMAFLPRQITLPIHIPTVCCGCGGILALCNHLGYAYCLTEKVL